MRIALFKRVEVDWSYETVKAQSGHDTDETEYDGFVRISEWQDVEFTPRSPEEIVPAQLAALDDAEKALCAQFQVKRNQIAEARSRVRSLTHQTEAA